MFLYNSNFFFIFLNLILCLFQHGFGRKQCSNSDVYDVSWKEGVHEGNGKYTRCNGDIYMGGWKGRLMYGRAVMKRLNGDLFDASFFRQEPFSDNVSFIGFNQFKIDNFITQVIYIQNQLILNSNMQSNARGRCSNLIQVIWRSHVKVTTV